jgi:hypothetical protein
MRRCRLAQLRGRAITEAFEGGPVTGYVDSIRADLFTSPMQWLIGISLTDTKRPRAENNSRYVQSLIIDLHASVASAPMT